MKYLRITGLYTYVYLLLNILLILGLYRAVYSLFTLPMPGLYTQYVAKIRVVLCSIFLLDQVYVIPRPFNFTSGMHKFIYLFIHIFKVTDCKPIYSVACVYDQTFSSICRALQRNSHSLHNIQLYSRQIQSLTECNTVQLHQSHLLLHSVNLYRQTPIFHTLFSENSVSLKYSLVSPPQNFWRYV